MPVFRMMIGIMGHTEAEVEAEDEAAARVMFRESQWRPLVDEDIAYTLVDIKELRSSKE
jgi:hypothetical protein